VFRSHASSSAPISLPLVRWLALVALLIGEVGLLTLHFDTDSLLSQSEWWAELLKHAHWLPPLVVSVAAATLLLGGIALWEDVRRLSVPPWSLRSGGKWLLCHLAALAAFVGVVTVLLREETPAVLSKSVWMVLGIVLVPVVAGSWALIVLPAHLWLQVMRRNRLSFLSGAGVGALAFGAGLLSQNGWRPLAGATLVMVRTLLGLVYAEVTCLPEEQVIGASNFVVEIGPKCSGYEGIGLVSVFVLAYLWLFRGNLRFPQALLLWPAGVVLLWLSNAVRIAVLIALGAEGWPEVAQGGFHAQAGWLTFDAVALGLIFVSRRLGFFAAQPACPYHTPYLPLPSNSENSHREKAVYPTAANLMPFLALVATRMAITAFTAGFDLLYPLRVLATTFFLWIYRRAYTERQWSWSWRPFMLGAVVFVLWITLVPSSLDEGSPLGNGLAHLSPARAIVWLFFRIVGATITVPLAEELAFRGYLLRRLQSAAWRELPPEQSTWVSLLISSILFGVLHNHWLAGTLAGLAYAFAFRHRGRLLDAVLAHATTNALLSGYVLATGAWALWS